MLAFLASDCQGDAGLGVDSPCGDTASQPIPSLSDSGGEATEVRTQKKAFWPTPEGRQLSRLTAGGRNKRSSRVLMYWGGRHGRLADRSPGVLTQAGDDRRQHVQD